MTPTCAVCQTVPAHKTYADHAATCGDCGQRVQVCSDCLLCGVWLTCTPCSDRAYGGVQP